MLLLSLKDTEKQIEFRAGGDDYYALIKHTNMIFNEENIPLELNHHTPTYTVRKPIEFKVLNPPKGINYPTYFLADTWTELRDKVNNSGCPIKIELPDGFTE